MEQFDISKLVSGGLLKLKNTVDNTSVNPPIQLYPVSALKVEVDDTPGNDTLLTELVVTLSADEVAPSTFTLNSEYMWLTGGTETTATDGTAVVEYTATVRGLFNTHNNNPPVAGDGGTRNYKSHKAQAICTVPEDYLIRYLFDLWTASTSTKETPAGEDLLNKRSISTNVSSNEIFYYSETYGDLIGVTNEPGSTGDSVEYTTFGGIVTGMTGLTDGKVYADYIKESTTAPTDALAGL